MSLSRIPSEIFGLAYDRLRAGIENVKKACFCPHLGARCTKSSTHRDIGHLPFGVCSVWHRPDFAEHRIPHIICPKRLGTQEAVQRAVSLVGAGGATVLLEGVRMGTLGTMDYVAVFYDAQQDCILDFAGIEVMAVSTTNTGQIIRAMLDALAGGLGESYNYGINYRQVLSRMLVQLCAKGSAFSMWGKKTIWIIQDVLYDYMEHTYDLRLPTATRASDPITLLIYSLVETEGRFELKEREIRSGQPRHFSDLLYTSNIPTKSDAEALLLKRIGAIRGRTRAGL